MAQNDHSMIIVIGGIFGILPDTLDFKVARFFYQEEYIVSPTSENPDLQEIADTIAKAIDQAYTESRLVKLKLNTIKLGADLFRQYTVRFLENQVIVKLGPTVNMSKNPIGEFDHDKAPVATAVTKTKILHTYEKATYVDIFSGPSFAFKKLGDGRVEAEFLPWHRAWSHSLVLGAILGAIGFLLYGLLTSYSGHWDIARMYGLAIFGGFSIHILEDQLGYMGSNLYWPITRERAQGLKWMHSGDAWPNFITVWLTLLAIVYNLNRFSNERVFNSSLVEYMAWAFFLPLTFIIAIGFLTTKMLAESSLNVEQEQLKEVQAENEEEGS